MWRAAKTSVFQIQLAVVIGVGLSLELAPPVLMDLGNINLLLFFGIGVSGLIIIGVPIAFSFGAATVSYVLLTSDLPLTVVVGRINEGMSHFFIGTARGGLSYVLLCAMYLENETNDASIHARDIAMRANAIVLRNVAGEAIRTRMEIAASHLPLDEPPLCPSHHFHGLTPSFCIAA